ncbi:MAG: hypothetical protein RBG13Loki_3188 [Promethearchaeota archaeon CR_4]|nr:MAG: hypothetical protein RBG13Loki_3188 [Candidatus Lokiarchaeota archaeon CR_4]
MSEEPQLPPIPAIGGLDKKERKRKKAVKISTLHCKCGENFQREFAVGDFLYKESDDKCQKCGKTQTTIVEIYQENVPRNELSMFIRNLNKNA